MKKSNSTYDSIPSDVALKIASSLEASDLSSLSCCSRVWRAICVSDCLWEPLCKERWPLLCEDVLKDPNFKGWRGFYMEQHKEKKDEAESVIKYVEESSEESELPLIIHLSKAIDRLGEMQFGFKDVRMLLFNPELDGSVNFVGLFYCRNVLFEQVSDLVDALETSNFSDCTVCCRSLFESAQHGALFCDDLSLSDILDWYDHGYDFSQRDRDFVKLFDDRFKTNWSSLERKLSR